jgi:hypothetical protein
MKKRKHDSVPVLVRAKACPDCGRAIGRGHSIANHPDSCLFRKHYPNGVRRPGVHLTTPSRDYVSTAIRHFQDHRLAVTTQGALCSVCPVVETVFVADGSDNSTADDDDSPDPDLRSKKRRSKKRREYITRVDVGEAERTRLESRGEAGYLDDNIVMLALERLCARRGTRVRAVPSNYYPANDGDHLLAQYMKEKEWPETLLIPVNLGRYHWSLFVLKRETHSIVYWDSMPTGEGVFSRLRSQLLGRLEQHSPGEAWTVTEQQHLPKQQDAFNCGVMVLLYAESIICKKSAATIPTSPEALKVVRSKIWSLISAGDDVGPLQCML